MIWVEDLSYDSEDAKLYLGPGEPIISRDMIQYHLVRNRELTDTIQIIYRNEFLFDGSKPNQSIKSCILDNNIMTHDWRGPLIVKKLVGVGPDPRLDTDIDLEDLRNVIDYFSTYNTDALPAAPEFVKAKGVKIACHAEQLVLGTAEFTSIDVPRDHPVFRKPIAPISQRVGMPLQAYKYPPDSRWKENNEIQDPYRNAPATFLQLKCDLDSDIWGWAPMQWQNPVDSVLVVGVDTDLTTERVQALCRFCHDKMQPLFETASEGGLSRKKVVEFLAKDNFEEFARKLLSKERYE